MRIQNLNENEILGKKIKLNQNLKKETLIDEYKLNPTEK
jgi:hypothetical protein